MAIDRARSGWFAAATLLVAGCGGNGGAGGTADASPDSLVAPPPGDCSTGAVTSACKCGGALVTGGYCCGGEHQTGPCPTTPKCPTGAVTAACSCGGSDVTSGFCCSGVAGAVTCNAASLSKVRLDGGLATGTRTYDGDTFSPLLPYLTAGVAENSTEGLVNDYPVADTAYPALYQIETWVNEPATQSATFTIPVTNGAYSVYLHFVDWSTQTHVAGDRLFDVALQGNTVIKDLDIIATVGKNTALVEGFDLEVTTGSVMLTLTSEVFYPEIAAVEILPQGEPHLPTTGIGACTNGAAATAACTCGLMVAPVGQYCCGGIAQTSACTTTTAMCAGGPVTQACLCGTTSVSSGYCCGGTAQAASCGTPSPNAYYVATNGSDTNDGSEQHPFLTLEKAQQAVQALVSAGTVPQGGYHVYLRAGTYARKATLTLTSADSGPSSSSPITWAAYPGETVRLSGGQVIPSSAFTAYAAIPGVYSVNLASLGIAQGNSDYGYGALVPRDSWDPIDASQLEVFFDDVPMVLARWPNVGQAGAVSDGFAQGGIPGWAQVTGYTTTSGGFNYTGTRPSTWSKPTEAWIAGRPAWVWDQDDVQVADIDTGSQHIDTVQAFGDGPGDSTNSTGSVFFAYNIFEELDAANEYYLDQSTSTLYFYPPSDLSQGTVSVSLLGDRMLIVDSTAANITFSGLIFEVSRAPLFDVQNGASSILFDHVTLRNTASYACTLGTPSVSGTVNTVQNSVVSGAGDWGVQTEGASTVVKNSEFFNLARWGMVYKPAIWLQGSNVVVENNYIHDMPHEAIHFSGTNHTISYNLITNACNEADDSGVIYAYQQDEGPTTGTVISNNIIYDIPWTFSPMGENGGGVNAVYLDGGSSGVTVENNIFYSVTMGVHIDSSAVGDSLINNMIGDTTWVGLYEGCQGGGCPSQTVSTCNVGDDTNGYLSAKGTPNGFESSCAPADTSSGCAPDPSMFTTDANNMYNEAPLFTSASTGDFSLAASSPARSLSCFVAIDTTKIGLQ